MITSTYILTKKDIALVFSRGGGIGQAFLLGLLLFFVFSLTQQTAQVFQPHTVATIFWLASVFCQVLIFNTLFSLEEENSQRTALILAPVSPYAIWLSKGLSGFILLLLVQCMFFPAALFFLGQTIHTVTMLNVLSLLLANIGICTLGSLLGALTQGQTTQESLLSIILFPLLVPLLLAGINTLATFFSPEVQNIDKWCLLLLAFTILFIGVGILLFPYVYSDE